MRTSCLTKLKNPNTKDVKGGFTFSFPRRKTYITETCGAVIPVQSVVIVRKIRYSEINFAVQVIIPDRDSHRGLFASFVIESKPRKITHVLERSIMLVAIKILRH